MIGKKLGMTHVFDEDGRVVPVTIIEIGPCRITQVKTEDRDGYDALQLGYGTAKDSRVNKPLKGHFQAAKTELCALLREFRVDDASGYKVGTGITVDALKIGVQLDVVGKSIGKGFTGVVKRHGFSGGPKTHGSKSHDVPGSIGGSAYPGRVWPGQKLPGRAGGERVTIKRASVVGVDPDRKLLLLKGPVPGKRNSIVMLTPSRGFELSMEMEEPQPRKEAPPKAEAGPEAVETAAREQGEGSEAPAGAEQSPEDSGTAGEDESAEEKESKDAK